MKKLTHILVLILLSQCSINNSENNSNNNNSNNYDDILNILDMMDIFIAHTEGKEFLGNIIIDSTETEKSTLFKFSSNDPLILCGAEGPYYNGFHRLYKIEMFKSPTEIIVKNISHMGNLYGTLYSMKITDKEMLRTESVWGMSKNEHPTSKNNPGYSIYDDDYKLKLKNPHIFIKTYWQKPTLKIAPYFSRKIIHYQD